MIRLRDDSTIRAQPTAVGNALTRRDQTNVLIRLNKAEAMGLIAEVSRHLSGDNNYDAGYDEVELVIEGASEQVRVQPQEVFD